MIYLENDYELLYLAKENEEAAIDFLFEKYQNLIKSRIYAFRIKQKSHDDFFQEGLIMLDKAIQTFDEKYNKTFNKYFDLLLQRRFMQILKKEQPHFYNVTYSADFYDFVEEYACPYQANHLEFDDSFVQGFSELEKKVYQLRMVNGYKTSDVCRELNCSARQVYNAVLRIRMKVK